MSYFQKIGLLSSIDALEVKQSIQKLDSFLQGQGRDVVYEQKTAMKHDGRPTDYVQSGLRAVNSRLFDLWG